MFAKMTSGQIMVKTDPLGVRRFKESYNVIQAGQVRPYVHLSSDQITETKVINEEN